MPKVIEEPGRLHIGWEIFKAVALSEKDNSCQGCTETFFIGEFVGLLEVGGNRLYFHEGCLNQVAMVLIAFLEETHDVRENVSTRKN